MLISGAIALGILIYLSTGVYSIESGQSAVILRFGQAISETTEPGINYHMPWPFERAVKAYVRQVKKVLLQDKEGIGLECFAGDENLILIKAVISYDIENLM